MGYIYTLRDPRNYEIRYIGKTVSSLISRYRSHLTPSELQGHTHKNRWIKKLLSLGLKPEIEVLDTIGNNKLIEAEIFYIKYFRQNGFNLTNATDGGEGQSPGYKPSKATLAKSSKALKGKKKSQSFIENMSKRMTGNVLSEAVKKKISKTLSGRKLEPFSEERKLNMAKGRGAKPFTDQFGNVYYSIRAAARAIRGKHSNIVVTLQGKQKHVKGYEFKYLPDPESNL